MTSFWYASEFEVGRRRERLTSGGRRNTPGLASHESVRLQAGMALVRLGLAVAGPISPQRDLVVATR